MNASVLIFAVVLPWLIVLLLGMLGAWIGFQLIQQNGRLLGRLEGLEARLGQLGVAPAMMPGLEPLPAPRSLPDPPPMPAGLPIGSEAPPFELPDLNGERRSLADFRGKNLLLVFFNPRCGFCSQMAPDLATLTGDGSAGQPLPLVVTTGDPEDTRKLFAEHGVNSPALVQEGMEVASQYQAHGTPMGYLVDAEGRIASDLAAGAPALLSLAMGPSPNGNGHGSNGHGGALGGRRELAESKIERNGLPAGTPAPNFTLPRLDEGELSLEEFRGTKVLLVFSDPNCGPCNVLVPELEQRSRQTADVQVLMISRGDLEANRAKAAEHGVTFPVVLQRQWEISREYGMFATPVGYLIDEQGVTAADVATGVEPILELLARAVALGNGEPRCKCGRPVGECKCGRETGRQPAIQHL